jgi:hypothetical protein
MPDAGKEIPRTMLAEEIEAMKDTGGELTVKSKLSECGQIEISVSG